MSDDDDDEKTVIGISAGVSVSANINKNHGKTKIFERICKGIGKWYDPIHKVREAESEKEVSRIKRETELENAAHDALMERMNSRTTSENVRDQENLENIYHNAGEDIDEDADVENLDNDWIRYYTENARLISDDKMQQIWANILSGEVNTPGSFSKKTLSILQTLSKKDAESFENLCGFNCHINSIELIPTMYRISESIYADNNINLEELIHLSNLGLIQLDTSSNLARSIPTTMSDTIMLFIIYYDNFILFQATENKNLINTGHCLYTQSGQELAKICSSQKKEGFLEYIIEKIKSDGHEMIEQYNKDNIPSEYREQLKEKGIDF